eukprot:881915-Pelagomonas_calceolata.AAC.1
MALPWSHESVDLDGLGATAEGWQQTRVASVPEVLSPQIPTNLFTANYSKPTCTAPQSAMHGGKGNREPLARTRATPAQSWKNCIERRAVYQ